MKKTILSIAFIGLFSQINAQNTNIGINTTDPKATLDINAKTTGTSPEGILIPRLTGNQLKTMPTVNLVESTMIFATNAASPADGIAANVTNPGFYFWSGGAWQGVAVTSSLKNIYTSDGEISAARTVTIKDTGSLVFKKSDGSTTTNEVVNVLGTVKTTAVDLNSDQRLKENIKTLENTNSTLSTLRPVSYNWNAKGKEKGGNNKLQYGFIAQEVEKVLPHLVNTDKEGFKSVNYIEVIPVLTKALQEEKLRNDSQEAKLEAQQKEINELKKLVEKLAK